MNKASITYIKDGEVLGKDNLPFENILEAVKYAEKQAAKMKAIIYEFSYGGK